jgi:hypothetical protein
LASHWTALRAARATATASLEERQDRAGRVRNYQQLLADLNVLLGGRDVPGFERRLREALGANLPEKEKEPALPANGGWELIELKPVPQPAPRKVEVFEARVQVDPLPAAMRAVPAKPQAISPAPIAAPAVATIETVPTATPAPARTTSPPMPRAPRIVPRSVSGDDVRFRAYCLWEKHGRPEGREVYFWAMAERELRGEASPSPAAPPVSH